MPSTKSVLDHGRRLGGSLRLHTSYASSLAHWPRWHPQSLRLVSLRHLRLIHGLEIRLHQPRRLMHPDLFPPQDRPSLAGPVLDIHDCYQHMHLDQKAGVDHGRSDAVTDHSSRRVGVAGIAEGPVGRFVSTESSSNPTKLTGGAYPPPYPGEGAPYGGAADP